MRVALVGAFPFPLPQGSQVYLAGQARALRDAGALPVLVTYPLPRAIAGRLATDASSGATATWEGIPHVVVSPALCPAGARSGPSWKKPLADAALALRYRAAHRRHRFDVALAHNTEAAVAAIAARPLTGVPVVYVAHTLLGRELSTYGPPAWTRFIDRFGAGIDGWVARRADGILALCEDARELLGPHARCEIRVIPPGHDLLGAPDGPAMREACRRQGLEPGGFALYTGNLDGYQDLALLDAAAARRPAGSPPVVVATHDARDGAERLPHLRVVELRSFADVRALLFAAASLVATRRRPGGFPIKLLNYMETGRPIVAFRRAAPGLVHDRTAWLLDDGAGPGELAAALEALHADPSRATRIGAAARRHLRAHHAWPSIAARTLDFARSIRARC